jgi:pilus assembly protein Flp/PilA
MRFIEILKSLHQDESGQDLVEYALVLAAVAFAVVAGSTSLSSVIGNAIVSINAKIASAITQIS